MSIQENIADTDNQNYIRIKSIQEVELMMAYYDTPTEYREKLISQLITFAMKLHKWD